MKKLSCRAILKEIKRKTEEEILVLEYTHSNDPYPVYQYPQPEETNYKGEVVKFTFGWARRQKKNMFMYRVIFDYIFYTMEGKKLKVSDGEIQTLFNTYFRRLEVVESFEHRDEFTTHLYAQAMEVLETENREAEEHKSQGFLRRLLDKDSTLELQVKKIREIEQKLRKLNNDMKQARSDWDDKEITGSELDEIREGKDRSIAYFTAYLIHLNDKYKRTSESAKYRRRKFLKSCFDSKHLYGTDIPVESPVLVFKNASTLKFIIEQYCSWYNNVKFVNEIAEAKKPKPSKQELIRLARISAIEEQLKLDPDISNRQLSKVLKIPKSSLDALVSKYKLR